MGVGILGGTFDPVHLGHLVIAEEVRVRLGLDKTIFIPAGEPWLKQSRPITPAVHRVEMVRRAISSNPHFVLSLLEIERAGPTHTIDTVTMLKQMLGAQVELFLILGLDTLMQLPEWRKPDQLIKLCRLAVVNRPGYDLSDISRLEEALHGVSSCISEVKVPDIGISSTEIRERVKKGVSIRYLVPTAVEEYIAERGLYSQ